MAPIRKKGLKYARFYEHPLQYKRKRDAFILPGFSRDFYGNLKWTGKGLRSAKRMRGMGFIDANNNPPSPPITPKQVPMGQPNLNPEMTTNGSSSGGRSMSIYSGAGSMRRAVGSGRSSKSSSSRSSKSRRSKRSGKGKKRKGTNRNKRKRGLSRKSVKKLCREITNNGPSAEVSYWLPNTVTNGTAFQQIPSQYNDVWHNSTGTWTKSGVLSSSRDEEQTMIFVNFTAKQILEMRQTGQKSDDQQVAGTAQGIFDPQSNGGISATGGTVVTRNYVKAYENFKISWAKVEFFVNNINETPCRLWVDYSTPKKWSDTHFFQDLTDAFNNQPLNLGYDGQTAATTTNIFKDPRFSIIKVRKLEHWHKPSRKEFYIEGGKELKIVYNFKNLVWKGKTHAFQSGNANDYVPNFSQMFAFTIRGLTGYDGTNVVAGFAAASIAVQCRVTLNGHREDVMNPEKFNYAPFYPLWGKPALAVDPVILRPNLTAYT